MAVKTFLDYPGLQEVIAKIKENYAPIQALEYKGTVPTISALPTVANEAAGNMYNIVSGGLITADFVEYEAGEPKKIPDGTNVAAVNTETDPDQPAVMKWDILPGVFNLDDRLQFGDTMPTTELTDGRIFLYLGPTTYTYDAVTPTGTEDPSALGWYEYDAGTDTYSLSEDTEVQSGTSYFVKNEQYVTGVIYKYVEDALVPANSRWVAQSSGDTFVRITEAQIDALFD